MKNENADWIQHIEAFARTDTNHLDHWYLEGHRLICTYGYTAVAHLCVVKYYLSCNHLTERN